MYYLTKKLEVAGAHKLILPYESKCQNLHGHNWIITVTLRSDKLTEYGMVMDFTHIKQKIHDRLDHQYLNAIFDFNPTAENISKWIADELTGEFDAKKQQINHQTQQQTPNNSPICRLQ